MGGDRGCLVSPSQHRSLDPWVFVNAKEEEEEENKRAFAEGSYTWLVT